MLSNQQGMNLNVPSSSEQKLLKPDKYGLIFEEWRLQQTQGIQWIEDADWFEDINKRKADDVQDFEVKVLEAPTGTGKTGLIIGVANRQHNLRFLVLCATKLEQEQYMKVITSGFDVVFVKGKNNFHCGAVNPGVFLGTESRECSSNGCALTHVDDAPCQGGLKCEFRDECAYFHQRNRAKNARVVVTSYPMGLRMINMPNPERQGLGKFDVIVEDEGHVLDQMMESFLGIVISRRVLKRIFNVSLPSKPEQFSIPYWKTSEYINDLIEDMEKVQFRLDAELEEYSDFAVNGHAPPKELVRDALIAGRYISAFHRIQTLDSKNWLVEDEGKGEDSPIKFTPVWTTTEARDILFGKGLGHIIMSGTIPSAKMLAQKTGIEQHEMEFKRLPYTFPIENRRIKVLPRVDLTWKNIQNNLPRLVTEVDEILSGHRDQKTLIHTVSYRITEFLKKNSQYSWAFYTHNSRNRIQVLNQFKLADPMAVLVSPSFDKAVDLPGDECEAIIIAKLPWPNVGNPVIKRRMQQNKGWYEYECLSTLLQMIGRGNRQPSDVCDIYILDKGAKRFLDRVSGFLNPDLLTSIKYE